MFNASSVGTSFFFATTPDGSGVVMEDMDEVMAPDEDASPPSDDMESLADIKDRLFLVLGEVKSFFEYASARPEGVNAVQVDVAKHAFSGAVKAMSSIQPEELVYLIAGKDRKVLNSIVEAQKSRDSRLKPENYAIPESVANQAMKTRMWEPDKY